MSWYAGRYYRGQYYAGSWYQGAGVVPPVPPTPAPIPQQSAVGGGGGGPRRNPFPTHARPFDVRSQAAFVECRATIATRLQVKARVRGEAAVAAPLTLPSLAAVARVRTIAPTHVRGRLFLDMPQARCRTRTAHPVALRARLFLTSPGLAGKMTSSESYAALRRQREEMVLLGMTDDEVF